MNRCNYDDDGEHEKEKQPKPKLLSVCFGHLFPTHLSATLIPIPLPLAPIGHLSKRI
jgi:hypothetical protein